MSADHFRNRQAAAPAAKIVNQPVRRRCLIAIAMTLGFGTIDRADAVTTTVPSGLDFFNYGNAPSGTSTSVPVFSVLNSGDPDRIGTMVLGFDTSPSVPNGLEPSRYAVSAVRLVLNLQNSLLYDPTYDAVTSYIAGGADADPGRPFRGLWPGIIPAILHAGEYQRGASARSGDRLRRGA